MKLIIGFIWFMSLGLACLAPFWNPWWFCFSFAVMFVAHKWGRKIDKYLYDL